MKEERLPSNATFVWVPANGLCPGLSVNLEGDVRADLHQNTPEFRSRLATVTRVLPDGPNVQVLVEFYVPTMARFTVTYNWDDHVQVKAFIKPEYREAADEQSQGD